MGGTPLLTPFMWSFPVFFILLGLNLLLMSPKSNRNILFPVAFFAAILLLAACASPGTPSGGPRDEAPPRFVRSNPGLGATEVDRQRIVLEFDEIVNVKDAFSKVVISPTSANTPRVTSNGKRVYINFSDTLEPNTTYTVDFGNAIEDNNEGNKLSNFAYWFSTGPELDTLRISGMVLAANNLEPQQSMIVGVHSIQADSAFKTLRLERVAKTDDRGRFTIRGLKPGDYRLFALADANNDYKWDNPQEDIAFTDFTINPYTEEITVRDTIYDLKTGRIDTIVDRIRTRYLPNNILLNSFNVDFRQKYLVKNERLDSTRISFIFSAPNDSLPLFRLIGNEEGRFPTPWVVERSIKNDSVTLWLNDPTLISTDTLLLEARYPATDKNLEIIEKTDTLRFITNRPRTKPKKERRQKNDTVTAPAIKFLDMTVKPMGSLDVQAPITIDFAQPLTDLKTDAFHLEQMVDSIWKPVAITGPVPIDSVATRTFKIDFPHEYEGKYRLRVDSIAATGIYGNFTKPVEQDFNVKKRDDYFDLRFRLASLPDSIPCFVELLNSSDQPVRTVKVENAMAVFTDVPLGTYYARLIEDSNGNGVYDTGNYDEHRQPEYVYYYPKALKITKRWDLEQPWNITEVALDKQKPSAIKKNKPERDKRSNNNAQQQEEDEIFDPTANPFDPNDKKNRRTTGTRPF